MDPSASGGSVAVRLEGGLGDHILGMRVLRFVRERYPCHNIVIYSDAGGHSTQLRVASMSPYISTVVPVYAKPARITAMGRLENIRPQDLRLMLSSDVFVDAHGETMFLEASVALNAPVFAILAHRPELLLPGASIQEATSLLAKYEGAVLVGLNLTKHGAALLRRYEARIVHILQRLLEHPNVIVLNILSSSYEFTHWPEPERTMRHRCSVGESQFLRKLCKLSDRIVPCVDLPIDTIAAVLSRCRYFIGVDNGIKHLAWALGVPHTFFSPVRPRLERALRWMPDLNRMLLFDCPESTLVAHLAEAMRSMDR
jgi:hypothetical protein